MALNPPVIYGSLVAARAAGGFPFAGFKFDQFALAVSAAVCAWAIGQPQNVTLIGASAGVIGGGTIATPTTRIFVPPTIPIMAAALAGAGFVGPLAPSLATVVTLGISGSFTAVAQYSGAVAGVGVGQDVAKIVLANPATLMLILSASLAGIMGPGILVPQLATGLANGISGILLTGGGTGSVVGVPGPAPSTGISTSVLL